MNNMERPVSLALGALVVMLVLPAAAQNAQLRYRLEPLNFDLWCQETVRLPVARCDQRLPEDMERFEAYRAVIERYEIPYLQERQNQLQLDRALLHHDPVGNPISQDPLSQSQTPTLPKATNVP